MGGKILAGYPLYDYANTLGMVPAFVSPIQSFCYDVNVIYFMVMWPGQSDTAVLSAVYTTIVLWTLHVEIPGSISGGTNLGHELFYIVPDLGVLSS